MAMNNSPARIVRESIETPATRARGLSPAPSTASIGSETCRSIHRINSLKSWRYEDTAHVGAFSPFLGLLLGTGKYGFQRLSPARDKARYVPNPAPLSGRSYPRSR